MIHQDKLKLMAQMAVYDKKKSRKDFSVYHYEKGNYILWQVTKTVIAVTIAFVILAGFVALWNLDEIISNFATYNYKSLILIAVAVYLILLCCYIFITIRKSLKRYEQVKPGVEKYMENLKKLKAYCEETEKLKEEFEKGEWNDGQ